MQKEDHRFYAKWIGVRQRGKKRYILNQALINGTVAFVGLILLAGFLQDGLTVEYFTSETFMSNVLFFGVLSPIYGWTAARSRWNRNEDRFDDLERLNAAVNKDHH
ncbi:MULTISPECIES: hypothetical protein [Alteribacter]|uniref:2TM domain-containing protein n=1 Tax=Alteribacter keqinensis TaxID=2483800 RepID=A0A3M7TUI4_9BACI|nr:MULTISPECIES: hypothetical protein [Alteribacter]MBM7094465.1 hypothetical protein [Alteribacter salitolerans]RNA69316.1 hypothetical protein EBO34_05055 [Alteribacter keqinensis]